MLSGNWKIILTIAMAGSINNVGTRLLGSVLFIAPKPMLKKESYLSSSMLITLEYGLFVSFFFFKLKFISERVSMERGRGRGTQADSLLSRESEWGSVPGP